MNLAKRNVGVIAVLIILAMIGVTYAILRPVFQDARRMQKSATCVSNMKQLGLAILQYSQDYHDTLPPSVICHGSDLTNRRATATVVNLLDPYLTEPGSGWDSHRLWDCPAQPGSALYTNNETDANGLVGTIWPQKYICNMNVLRPMGGAHSHYKYFSREERAHLNPGAPDYEIVPEKAASGPPVVRTSNVIDPGYTLALIEWHHKGDHPNAFIDSSDWQRRLAEKPRSLGFHKSNTVGINVCFVDGHGSWCSVDDLYRKNHFHPDDEPWKPGWPGVPASRP